MRKPYNFRELSDIPCMGCGKFLKKNLLAKKPNARRCYSCHRKHVLGS